MRRHYVPKIMQVDECMIASVYSRTYAYVHAMVQEPSQDGIQTS